MLAWVAAALAAACALGGGVARASGWARPWSPSGEPPLAEWVVSAKVVAKDEPILTGPSKSATRRGAAARDARLPIFAARRGPGCAARWLEIGPLAWICEDAVELSGNLAIDPAAHTFREQPDGLPFRYYFVGPDGSQAYRRLEAADVGDPDMYLEPGFSVAVIAERMIDGVTYGRTNNGYWVPMRDLGPAHPIGFRGEEVPPGVKEIPFAWVNAERAPVFSRRAGPMAAATKARFELVPFLGEETSFRGKATKIGDDQWMASSDLRHPVISDPPPEVDVAAGERWIDVDIATQTLVAYEGSRPVYATLVSTGKGRPGTVNATPKGTHRIWIKLLATTMDNLEDENASRYYRMEGVPYVQFFSRGYALHGAYWHRSFGRVRSHGCVNLAPLDAQRLFWFTSPRLPAGWTAVAPTPYERGTIVRVR